jgi:hypothetical protein
LGFLSTRSSCLIFSPFFGWTIGYLMMCMERDLWHGQVEVNIILIIFQCADSRVK